MNIIYKSICEEIIKAKEVADFANRQIDKIELTKWEMHEFNREIKSRYPMVDTNRNCARYSGIDICQVDDEDTS